jgi:hypothetical protein
LELLYFGFSSCIKRLETQSNGGSTAKVMERLDEMLKQVDPFAELYKSM